MWRGGERSKLECTWRPIDGWSLIFTCATCSSSSGLPFTRRRISSISCWYSFLRWRSCFLQRLTTQWWTVPRTTRLGHTSVGHICHIHPTDREKTVVVVICVFLVEPEFFEFGLVGLCESQVGVVGLGPPQHHPLQLLLPLLLLLPPPLLLLLGLPPLLQSLSTQGDNVVTAGGRCGWGGDFGRGG